LSGVSANDDQFLAELNLASLAEEELVRLLSNRIPEDSVEELLDSPFRLRTKLRPQTRFSTGSFPVFYSALSIKTAKAEVAHWFRKNYVGNPRKIRTAYFQGFSCTSAGLEKDVRSKARDWPNLVHDSDYSFCNQLGVEERELGVDGLVVPSVRHEGANMPIFVRQAITGPGLEGIVQMTYSPEAGDVAIDFLPQE